ncbi:MAG: cytochrome c oxidase subunit 3, partial [Alphaproteobacteria bacterium]
HALLNNDRKGLIRGLTITVLLGVLFTTLQIWEYSMAPFKFNGGGVYSSTFFLATGFHGFHVFVGTTFLFVCLIRAMKGHFSPERHFGFEAAACIGTSWTWCGCSCLSASIGGAPAKSRIIDRRRVFPAC